MAAWLGFGGKSPPGPISFDNRTFKRYGARFIVLA